MVLVDENLNFLFLGFEFQRADPIVIICTADAGSLSVQPGTAIAGLMGGMGNSSGFAPNQFNC